MPDAPYVLRSVPIPSICTSTTDPGFIGNFALLGGYGWAALQQRGQSSARLMFVGSALTIAAMLWLALAARTMVAPYAAADQAMTAVDADWLLVDDTAAPFAQDLVLNPPDLDRRPIRLAASAVRADAAWTILCRDTRVAIADDNLLAPIRHHFGVAQGQSAVLANAVETLSQAGCNIDNRRKN